MMNAEEQIATRPRSYESSRCQFCDDPIDADSGPFCETCDENHEWCTICNDYVHSDEPCRHIYYDDCGAWLGSGSYDPKAAEHDVKLLCQLIGREAVGHLRAGLDSGDYKACYVYGSILAHHGIVAEFNGIDIGPTLTAVAHLYKSATGNTLVGSGWLLSLEPGKTRTADLLSVKWIDEWLAVQKRDRKGAANG